MIPLSIYYIKYLFTIFTETIKLDLSANAYAQKWSLASLLSLTYLSFKLFSAFMKCSINYVQFMLDKENSKLGKNSDLIAQYVSCFLTLPDS